MAMRATGNLDTTSYTSTWGEDYAANDPAALSYDRMNQFLGEISNQPQWRGRADAEADYYDSNQYTGEELEAMRAKGIPPIVVNLIAPAINMVLGLEAKTRTDWVVKPDKDQDEDAANALSVKLKEAERMSGADRAISDAYAAQIKTGLGWVETARNKQDPFGYPYVCNYVHRREIWWDWHDYDPGLKKARYLVRRKWYDEDVAIAYFPKYAELIRQAIRGWADWDPTTYDQAPPLYMDNACERNFTFQDEEWRDSLRRRVCLYEVWYRTYERGYVIKYRTGKVAEFDDTNKVQTAALMSGIAELEACTIPRMRLSWWMGPHRFMDMPTPHPHQEFPYVPFWGFREDRTGTPYGMIRAMRPLQDEVNARRARMLWQLSAKRVFVDEDATSDHNALRREVARPDLYAKINTRKGQKSIEQMIKIEDNASLTAQQFQVYLDAATKLQDAGGVYPQQMGKKDAADSGVAISQLIEQGTTTLAEINDNKNFARALVGNRLMALITFDMRGKPETVKVKQIGGRQKRVNFNTKKKDETTNITYLENDVTRMQMSVVLGDMPSTPTHRMQQFVQLADFVKGLPENLQIPLVEIVINASDIPHKDEVLKRIQEALGINTKDPEEMDEEERAQFEAAMKDQAKNKAMEDALKAATVELEEARGALANAQAELATVKADEIKVTAGLNPELSRHAPPPGSVVANTPGMQILNAADQQMPQAPPPQQTQ